MWKTIFLTSQNLNKSNLGTENVDISQIESMYPNARIAYDIVKMCGACPDLKNILAIVPSHGNEYGFFNTGEEFSDISTYNYTLNDSSNSLDINDAGINPNVDLVNLSDEEQHQKLINWLNSLVANPSSPVTIDEAQKYYDNFREQIENANKGYVIHVNIDKIISENDSDLEAVFQIASTIVHEVTHALGARDEATPVQKEKQFKNWFENSINTVLNKYPHLKPEGEEYGTNGLKAASNKGWRVIFPGEK